MRRREIEKKLNVAFSELTPDVLDKILTKCEKKKGFEKVNFMEKEKKLRKNSFHNYKLVGVLSVFIIFMGLFGFGYYNAIYSIDSIVELDINTRLRKQVNDEKNKEDVYVKEKVDDLQGKDE